MRFFKWSILILILFLNNANGQIIELCPNPYGDDGAEYIKAKCYGNCTLSDGEGSIDFNGTITAAKSAEVFYKVWGYYPDIEFPSRFALSNSGEEVFLYRDGVLIDSFAYGRELSYLDAGVIYFRNDGGWDFRYQDWSSFQPVSDEVRGRIIVCPCSYQLNAEEKILIASYTITDFSLADLKDKVHVEVFVDANPAGGIPVEEIQALKDLNVHFLESKSIKNFHYKFALIDGKKVVITTENWKWNKRGYIVEFESKNISSFLKDVLEHDLKYESDAGKRGGVKGCNGHYSGEGFNFEGEVEVFVLPDFNPVFDLISNANKRLYIQVPYIDFKWFSDTPLLDSIIKAAENGAKVRILLDSKYNAERNEKTVEFINTLGREKNLDIEARMMGNLPLHGKLVISDNKSLITSANFNKYGLKLNREVGIVIYSQDVSDFLSEQFIRDWGNSGHNLIYTIPALIILSISIVVTYRAMKR